MNLPEETKKFLCEQIRLIFPGEEFKIILFGSYAKGTAHSKSDIDIAIQGITSLNAAEWQKVISVFEESYLPQTVDVVDYHRVSEDFKKIIDSDGIELC